MRPGMERGLWRYLRLMVLWVMLLPFAASSLFAAGIMPTRAPSGAIMLVICMGEGGMMEVAVDPQTLLPIEAPDASDMDGGQHCYWAAAHVPFTPPETPPLRLPDAHRDTPAIAAQSTALRAAIATGLPPSTGPPVTL